MIPFNEEHALAAASFRPATRKMNVSFADRACLGTAALANLPVLTGDRKWEFKMADVTDAGILTTASDLLFSGGREGYFYALDARTGTPLWKSTVGGAVASGAMTYSVGGRQYVGVAAGNSLFTFALKQ